MKNSFAFFSSAVIPIFASKEITPKLCVNCKFFINTVSANEYGSINALAGNEYGRCSLFKKKGKDVDYLVPEKNDFLYCLTARSYYDMCGNEGKKYVNKLDNKYIH
uniref:Uncharacterized protein n=1 Tax=viral metagenome TaxID=1070528 RepID=A0A6C0LMP7_9ZZZZ